MHRMSRRWSRRLLVRGAVVSLAFATIAPTTAQNQEPPAGILDAHPGIQYAERPTTDRVAT